MKNLQDLVKVCLAEIEKAGITPGKIAEWQINSRAKKRWGMCSKKPNGECIIQIAYTLLADNRISEQACKETIIHEILHTCPECKGHTGKWAEYAMRMNELYGYHIKRTTSGEEKGVENYQASYRLSAKYLFCCKYCGAKIIKKKDCKFTHYYKNYGCGQCGMPRAFEKYRL